jgi:hypothetical protein
MKVIKLQAWEGPFTDRIMTLRDSELRQLRNYTVVNCFSVMLWTGTPLAVALATFATYVLSGHQLEVASALTSLALFDILRFPLFMLPQSTCCGYSATGSNSVHVCTKTDSLFVLLQISTGWSKLEFLCRWYDRFSCAKST